MDQQFSSSPSSSSSQYKDLLHRWDDEAQEQPPRDWLSCSASPSTRIENHDDDDNCDLGRGRSGLGRGGVGEGVGGGGSSGTSYGVIEREHMFDKVVTPSDVGKLNRLVIPKQHAEKYFPLDTSTSSSNNNSNNNNNENKTGLLLNFEDRTGKSWRFRYSYWNSSQSYVMTKGWSRFVKEKQLSAGDIVSFQRGVGDEIARQTFYIDWRRRPPQHDHYNHHHHHHLGTAFAVHHSVPGWTTTPTLYLRSHPYPSPNVPIWDRFSTNSTTHLPPISGNVVNMVPYGSSGSNVVNNPQYLANHNAGSLIFLRSSSFSSTSSSIPSINPSTLPSLALSSDGHHGWGVSNEPKVYESVPLVQVRPPSGGGVGGAAAKRSLRLFGVNMDCSSSEHHQDVEIEDGQVSSMGTCTKSAPSSTTLNFDLDPK